MVKRSLNLQMRPIKTKLWVMCTDQMFGRVPKNGVVCSDSVCNGMEFREAILQSQRLKCQLLAFRSWSSVRVRDNLIRRKNFHEL